MLRLHVSLVAESDIDQAIRFYNQQQAGLGNRFLNAIKRTMKKIQQMPQAASFAFEDTRYKAVDKFPFIILYELNEKHIRIIRVFNTFQDDSRL